MKNLVLIDGNSLINRAFYATPPLSNSKGVTTNAVLGFIMMLLKINADIKPEYLLVAFDRKEPTFRHKIFTEYKGTRKPTPPDLLSQIMLLKSVLKDLGVSQYEKAGSEADDIIGTLAKKFKLNTIIYTGDKDSFQLVDETTSVYFTRRGITEIEIYNAENFKEKTGIEPSRVIDLKACMGDSSDNIPGIAGVGEKTALELVKKYGTLENIYENVDDFKGKLKEKIETSKDIAFLSKALATIDLSVETGLELDDMKFSFPFPENARKTLVDLEFRALLKRTDIFAQTDENLESTEKQEESEPSEKIYVTSSETLNKILNGEIALFVGDDLHLANDEKTEYIIKIKQSFFDEGFMFDEAIKSMKTFVENTSNRLIVFSRKKIEHLLNGYGIELKAQTDDVSLLKYITAPTGREETLDDLLDGAYFDKSCPSTGLIKLNKSLKTSLNEQKEEQLYNEIELPLSKVLFDMERVGFRVDMDVLEKLNEKYNAELKILSEEIYTLAGERFNINSPKQLSVILYEKLNLMQGKKLKTGYSTAVEALERIEDAHEIVPKILRFRQISKLNSTYVEGIRALVDKSGVIHTVFNQTLTATGRLSSKEPNLQNIPIRAEEGREIRKAFIPRDDEHILVGADYSQIELRLLAHFSESTELIEVYKNGGDIHALTASQVFDVPLSEVTKEMRQNAKAVNFGIIYGISDFGLSRNIKCSPKKAGEYIKRYFESYPRVKEFMNENVEFARKNGYVSTLLNRKRYIPDINSQSFQLRSFSERVAMNMPLQGTSADIIKIAMVNVAKRLKNENLKSQLILQVHDELIIDALKTEQKKVENLLKEEMENAVSLRVPLIAEVYSGDNLFTAK